MAKMTKPSKRKLFDMLGKATFLWHVLWKLKHKHEENCEKEVVWAARNSERPNKEASSILRLIKLLDGCKSGVLDDYCLEVLDDGNTDFKKLSEEVDKFFETHRQYFYDNHAVTRWGQAGPDCLNKPDGVRQAA